MLKFNPIDQPTKRSKKEIIKNLFPETAIQPQPKPKLFLDTPVETGYQAPPLHIQSGDLGDEEVMSSTAFRREEEEPVEEEEKLVLINHPVRNVPEVKAPEAPKGKKASSDFVFKPKPKQAYTPEELKELGLG